MSERLVIAALAGFAAHALRPALSRLSSGWRDLSAYAVGVLSTLPFIVLLYDDLDRLSPRKRLISSYLLGFLSFGAGVSAGWLADTIQHAEE